MPSADTEKPARDPVNDRLLQTAMEQFGQKGLDGASTRDIARQAGTVMSSITYHFGGKSGLYLAVAEYAATQVLDRFGGAFDQGAPDDLSPDDAVAAVCAAAHRVLGFMLHPDGAPLARFIVREQMAATEAFDVIRAVLIGPVSAHLGALVAQAGQGRWSDEEVQLKTLTIFGQLLVFRVAHATVLAVTGWDDITPDRAARIERVVDANIRAILEQGAAS
ncbi:MAG: CerR family C-terminal domain-containing protein [Rhodobacteraceae bacterium]|nr:CerR family C-terminal domain-containing protein [Paracoccaceae bacterium]